MEKAHISFFCCILFTSFCFIAVISSSRVPVSPSILLFDERNQTGSAVAVRMAYVPNLTSKNFDNRAQSVCVNGTWLLYANEHYNEKLLGVMEYISGTSYCTDLRITNGQASSLRFVGSSVDIESDSITIYSSTYFQGQEEYFTSYASHLSVLKNSTQSVIVTGAAGWRLFDQKNFQGQSFCIQPLTRVPRTMEIGSANPSAYFIPDIKAEHHRFGIIQSLKKADCNE